MKTKICIICHKEFIPKHNAQKICFDNHYVKCSICNNNVELKKYNTSKYLKGIPLTCSKLCATESMKRTNLEKYGNVCSAQNKTIRKQIVEGYRERYGGDSPFCNKEIQEYSLKVRKNKSLEEKQLIKDKVKQTNLERYGNENYNNPEKFRQTMLNKYGVNYTNESEELKLKQQNTMLKRYGSISSFSNKLLHSRMMDKAKATNLERYGVPYYVMTESCRDAGKNIISKTNKIFMDMLVEQGIIFDKEFSLLNYSFDLIVGNTLIEIDPTYTHNATIGPYYKDKFIEPKDKNYHQNKSKAAKANGYHCIHIFDWDDKNKIINLLKSKQNIYARKCAIKEVTKLNTDNFLNTYHLQNTCKCQTVRLGLYYNEKLVQIMTFGKPRYNKNYQWELLRLCSESNYKVVGGAEKLFKYFINNFNPESIISYCDLSKFTGDVYEKLGFNLSKITSPSCHWSKYNLMITNNLLNQRGYDQLFKTSYGKGTSNRELMIKNGWREVYDCGQATYIWKRS